MKTIVATLFFITGILISDAQTFYVSPGGSNSNPGTVAFPWLTFQKACNSATPGSTVYLRAGVYQKAQLNVSGTPGNYITFTNYPGETAVIDGGSVKRNLFYAQNKSYIKIIGLEFRNAIGNYSVGVEFDGNCDYIEFRNNKIHDIHFDANPNAIANSNKNVNPFVVYATNATDASTNIIVDGNVIYNCRTGYSEACTINGNADGRQITNNLIHDITNIGIDAIGGEKTSSNPATDVARNGIIRGNTVYNCKSPYASAGGIYVDGGDDILIEKNYSHHNQYGIEVGCENKSVVASNVTVRENILANNDEAGLTFGGYNYPNTGKIDHCIFTNNIFYNNDVTNSGQGEITVSRAENCTFQNNCVHGGSKRLLMTTTINNTFGNSFNYNVWFTTNTDNTKIMFKIKNQNFKTFTAYKNSTVGWDANSVFGNPVYADAANTDFHITTGSVSYNAGNPSFIAAPGETDYDINQRIYSTAVDCGAYESQTPMRTIGEVEVDKPAMQLYPNPASEKLTIHLSNMKSPNAVLKMINVLGEVVLEQQVVGDDFVIDLMGIDKGVYFVCLDDGIWGRVVVQ